jgi:hypothetical protein
MRLVLVPSPSPYQAFLDQRINEFDENRDGIFNDNERRGMAWIGDMETSNESGD